MSWHLLLRPHIIIWENGPNFPIQIWDKIWSFQGLVSKSSKCVTQRETSMKILMFWYRTPDVIHKYVPSVSPRCWHCGTDTGSLFHIFWQCSMIQPFWGEVRLLIQKVLDKSLPLDPLHYLLGLPFPGLTKRANRLLSYILLAAKWLIPLCWLSNAPPPWPKFLQLVADIRRMEYLTASVHDTIPQFEKLWEFWDRSEFGTSMPNTIS